ncbi:HAD family hydrolase [Actinomadura rugatobispora]|uniref:HAD family hydrolase n=1 Tax=Actinomadura rugatobispora TaxID=1994 RepID=A0ABW0ZQ42_9ACTN|nr:phosphonatase-like hydrolase [Actinomadura rugatobispora]
MTGAERITIACLDLAGTTLVDGDAVETAFAEAIATVGVVAGTAAHTRAMARVREFRGRQKIEIFRALFAGDEPRAQAANLSFERSYDLVVDRRGLAPVPGAEAAIERLSGAGVRVCLTTGFSRRTLGRVLDTLGWWGRVDLALCPEDGGGSGRGRPYPDLILSAALRLGVDDVRHIAVCGDTDNDVLSGRRAGASIVAGVLTGAHSQDQLLGAGATHVLGSVKEFPDLFLPVSSSALSPPSAPPDTHHTVR